jgi:hypothetical protein
VEGATGTGAKLAGDAASLELDGPLRVSGTKTAFTVTVAAGNVCKPLGRSDDSAVEVPADVANASTDLIFVTPVGLTVPDHTYSVAFNAGGDCAANSWVIVSSDDSPLTLGGVFNVLVIKQ